MLSITAIIDFLLGLMRDEEAKAAFQVDPQGTLAKSGLQGVSGADIRDARLVMADRGDIQPTGHDWAGPRHADPVREIHNTTNNFEVRDVDQTLSVVNIDDRDTLINDSFNSNDNDNNDIDVVAVQDNDQIVVVKQDPAEEEPEPEPVLDDPVVTEPVEEPEVLIDDPVEEEPDLDPAIV